ncbi:PilZ domain-containing protein [Thiohalocapsa halophila]
MREFYGVGGESVLRQERRRFRRAGFDGVVAVEPVPRAKTTRSVALLASDLSEGGLGATTRDFFPRGSRLLLSLEPAEGAEPIRLMGEVARVAHVAFQDRWLLGVKFDGPPPAVRQRLRALLARRARALDEA